MLISTPKKGAIRHLLVALLVGACAGDAPTTVAAALDTGSRSRDRLTWADTPAIVGQYHWRYTDADELAAGGVRVTGTFTLTLENFGPVAIGGRVERLVFQDAEVMPVAEHAVDTPFLVAADNGTAVITSDFAVVFPSVEDANAVWNLAVFASFSP